MQAVILAAGMGNRLGEYTKNNTKCMVEVGEIKIIDRTIRALKHANINKIILVVGYKKDKLVNYLLEHYKDIDFKIYENNVYNKTNNIYSLFLAKEELIKDDTILLESDLVFDEDLLTNMINSKEKNLVAVAKYEHWMDGTVTRINKSNEVIEFISKKEFMFKEANDYYKTVNIYKFSKEFSEKIYTPFLEAYIKVYGENQYYESVLKILAYIEKAKLNAYIVNENWYEVDNPQDLEIANVIFAKKSKKFHAYDGHYGGFWRFPKLKDFCYLVNPYYPSERMLNHIKYFQNELIREYPSGLNIQNKNAAEIFKINKENIIVGNGAAELINILGKVIKGKLGVFTPIFNEYIRCFKNCELIEINSQKDGFIIKMDRMKEKLSEVDYVVIVNPDNPTGSFWEKSEMLEFIEECKKQNVICIIDESFVDFSEKEKRYTLITKEILEMYENLIVIKSISKSYGIPGLRLGILVSSNKKILKLIKEEMPIWNINSLAEYFLQIYSLYEKDYESACNLIANQRKKLLENLNEIKYITAYDSQANYIMCKLENGVNASSIANELLVNSNVLIKDLTDKYGMEGDNYIRIAVKDEIENSLLVKALKEYKG